MSEIILPIDDVSKSDHRAGDRRRRRNRADKNESSSSSLAIGLGSSYDGNENPANRYRMSSSSAPGSGLLNTVTDSYTSGKDGKKKKNKTFSNLPVSNSHLQVLTPVMMLLLCVFTLFLFFEMSMSLGGSYGGIAADPVYVHDESEIINTLQNALKRNRIPSERNWPVTVKDEKASFELIHYPGEKSVETEQQNDSNTVAAPQFFVTDVDQSRQEKTTLLGDDGRLLTRKVADAIGSYTSRLGQETNDPNTRTIFVSMVSYRDWRCAYTLENLLYQAEFPDRIRIGVVDEIKQPGDESSCVPSKKYCDSHQNEILCYYIDHIDFLQLNSKLSVGPTFARHLSQRMYRGEYYAMQIDSAIDFVKHWDTDIISQLQETRNEMAVLSSYLTKMIGNNAAQYSICNAVYEGTGPNRVLKHKIKDQPIVLTPTDGTPYLHPYWSSGFSFSRGHFILTVPYDPYLPLIGRNDEEISMALRGFTHGYDFYVPAQSICFDTSSHDEEVVVKDDDKEESADGEEKESTDDEEGKNLFLKNINKSSLTRIKNLSRRRLMRLISMERNNHESDWNAAEARKYGLGMVRDASKFFSTFGIHVKERVTERKLCDFVKSGTMHKNFVAHLRDDGMGIDYSKINFRFHELIRIHEG